MESTSEIFRDMERDGGPGRQDGADEISGEVF